MVDYLHVSSQGSFCLFHFSEKMERRVSFFPMHPRIPHQDPLQLCHDWLHSNLESYRMLYEEPSFGPTEKHGR